MRGSDPLHTKNLLKYIVLFQYIPRVLRVFPLYKEVTRTSGILTETAWAGAAFNLFLYMLASHVSTVASYDMHIILGRNELLRGKINRLKYPYTSTYTSHLTTYMHRLCLFCGVNNPRDY